MQHIYTYSATVSLLLHIFSRYVWCCVKAALHHNSLVNFREVMQLIDIVSKACKHVHWRWCTERCTSAAHFRSQTHLFDLTEGQCNRANTRLDLDPAMMFYISRHSSTRELLSFLRLFMLVPHQHQYRYVHILWLENNLRCNFNTPFFEK